MSVGSAWMADACEVQKGAQVEWRPAQASSRSPTCSGEALWECAKSALVAMRGSSLIIFDWDDTLFPTAELHAGGYLDLLSKPGDRAEPLPQSLPCDDLREVAAAAAQALRAAKSVGNTIIVTNADHGWVHETAARFMPGLAHDLQGIPVLSARSIFKPQGISESRERKVQCFRRIVQCFHSGPAGIFGVQSLVSIGDSMDEHEATMKVAQSCPCYVKSLKLMERPTMSQMAQQLEVFAAQLPSIATHAGNLDFDLGMMVAVEGILAEDSLREHLRSSRASGKIFDDSVCEPVQKKRRLPSHPDWLGA